MSGTSPQEHEDVSDAASNPSRKIVYLMRGLPSCGKSYTAARLAGESGVICETDQYFYTRPGDPSSYTYQDDQMEAARQWNFEQFCKAVDEGRSPVIVDRGNSRSVESKVYIQYARERGYEVQLREPESDWWREIRVLLKYKQYTGPVLDLWAERLAKLNRQTHRTSAKVIRRWMEHWKYDLTIEDILNVGESVESTSGTSD